jgi:hypothetical protein
MGRTYAELTGSLHTGNLQKLTEVSFGDLLNLRP